MAYGNWGGRAYRNGVEVPSHEDNTPYREDEIAAGYWQAFGRSDGIEPQHVTLGGSRVRLCGYKNYPVLFMDGNAVDLEPFKTEEYRYLTSGRGEIEGYAFEWEMDDDPSKVTLKLTEPDGTVWTGFSGYGMGAGWDD